VNVDFAVTLPPEDAHEEYAFLAAREELSDETVTMMDADDGLEYPEDHLPVDLASVVRKPGAVVAHSQNVTYGVPQSVMFPASAASICSRKPLSCSSRAASPTKKKLRDLRQTQRQRRLCSERREKVMLALAF
jgi:hypothetical protein